MGNEFTASNIMAYAAVLEAVQRRARFMALLPDGEVEGTLRALTPAEGDGSFLRHNGDVSQAWVWVTTTGGFETWVQLSELVVAHAEGGMRIDG